VAVDEFLRRLIEIGISGSERDVVDSDGYWFLSVLHSALSFIEGLY